MAFHVPERFRLTSGEHASDFTYGNNGAFGVRHNGAQLRVIASDGAGWEHVSVSLINRCPHWDEMAYIKSLFWDEEDCVMQLHPPKSEYVNQMPYCLHLWRPNDGREIPLPLSILVGIKK